MTAVFALMSIWLFYCFCKSIVDIIRDKGGDRVVYVSTVDHSDLIKRLERSLDQMERVLNQTVEESDVDLVVQNTMRNLGMEYKK